MRLDDEQDSTNVEDRTGGRRGGGMPSFGGMRLGGGKLGLGSIVIALIAIFVFKVDPGTVIGGMTGEGASGLQTGQQQGPVQDTPATAELKSVSRKVLGSTERRWDELYTAQGQQYSPPTLVFYSQQDMSGCGAAQAAMGPFYCPADQKIYIDTDFFAEMKSRFNAPGDFPVGYIIAHEVGHHIQTIDGTASKVRQAQSRAGEAQGNELQVRMELQADCYAGVWAKRDENLMEEGDLEEGMTAAQAIGDDTLQRSAGQRPVPESFTHGTAAQRMAWLKKGFSTGDPAACDTFSGAI